MALGFPGSVLSGAVQRIGGPGDVTTVPPGFGVFFRRALAILLPPETIRVTIHGDVPNTGPYAQLPLRTRPSARADPSTPPSPATPRWWSKAKTVFFFDHQVNRGKSADAPQLVPAVERVTALPGRVPATAVADRGL
jgi:hypothetical protein